MKEKETWIKISPKGSANRRSNNWAQFDRREENWDEKRAKRQAGKLFSKMAECVWEKAHKLNI